MFNTIVVKLSLSFYTRIRTCILPLANTSQLIKITVLDLRSWTFVNVWHTQYVNQKQDTYNGLSWKLQNHTAIV